MADHVQVGPTRIWYDVHGSGDPFVLLHGGMVDARWFEPNVGALAERVRVYTPDLRAHGHTADEMYIAMPNAELAVVPGTSHFLTQEKPELVNTLILDFLTKEPVATVAPVRRAAQAPPAEG
ncbi:alpha/beta fold hydrolase [Jiangella gansuensis]|uniref:alpha/beta fold hydrolase n=1 Tax=Jiangella gansuensis TaxID=281473 RepID=UPI0004B78D32|nr:alpha/beta hydrolase [Jiangella gansuensis]